MDLMSFHRVRTGIQGNASPGRATDLETLESSLRGLLVASGLFEEVEVGVTDDPDRLVIALCRYRPFHTERDVAQRLEQIWEDRVRHPFWEAHAVHVEEGHVELEAATRAGRDGPYVTVHVVAQKGGVPAQRQPPV
jgi:hypothetical protein